MNRFARRGLLIAIMMGLILAGMLLGCSPGAQQEGPVPTKEVGEPTATQAFKVNLPVTSTPTLATRDGTPLPTPTQGPTKTPKPTKTPWPTTAPTSAPVDDPDMVYVPGGEFAFGSEDGKEDETPQHTVMIDGFNIDIHPVSYAEYKEFVDDTGYEPPRNWEDGQIPAGKEDNPVVWVSYEDAVVYCDWAGKRLPTEIEWEKAARGTDGLVYPWGDTFDSAKCNSQEAGIQDTTAVDSYPEGASPYGVLDMSGNVWEWTDSWYQGYSGSLYSLERYGTEYRVLRGGSWYDSSERVRTTARNSAKPGFSFSTIGFRCVK